MVKIIFPFHFREFERTNPGSAPGSLLSLQLLLTTDIFISIIDILPIFHSIVVTVVAVALELTFTSTPAAYTFLHLSNTGPTQTP